MSFEQAMLRAQNLPTVTSTRAILWLAGVGDITANKKHAEELQSGMRMLDTPASGVKVTRSSVENGYYVDSIHLTDRRPEAMLATVAAAETAMLMTFVPVELAEARLTAYIPVKEPWSAWAALDTQEFDVTTQALEAAESIRSKMFEAAVGIRFQEL